MLHYAYSVALSVENHLNSSIGMAWIIYGCKGATEMTIGWKRLHIPLPHQRRPGTKDVHNGMARIRALYQKLALIQPILANPTFSVRLTFVHILWRKVMKQTCNRPDLATKTPSCIPSQTPPCSPHSFTWLIKYKAQKRMCLPSMIVLSPTLTPYCQHWSFDPVDFECFSMAGCCFTVNQIIISTNEPTASPNITRRNKAIDNWNNIAPPNGLKFGTTSIG